MKIGIIVYSKTGHTLEVAERLAAKLKVAGHEAVLERILPENESAKGKDLRFANLPETRGYDFLVFGAPVWAFSLCPIMKEYLERSSTIVGNKALAYVTMGFSFPGLGGTHAVRQMTKLITENGGRVIDTAIIGWGGGKREERMEEMLSNFLRTIQA